MNGGHCGDEISDQATLDETELGPPVRPGQEEEGVKHNADREGMEQQTAGERQPPALRAQLGRQEGVVLPAERTAGQAPCGPHPAGRSELWSLPKTRGDGTCRQRTCTWIAWIRLFA